MRHRAVQFGQTVVKEGECAVNREKSRPGKLRGFLADRAAGRRATDCFPAGDGRHTGNRTVSAEPPARPRSPVSRYRRRMLIAPDRHATIDDNFGRGDEARFIAGEEQRSVGGVAAVAGKSDRNPLQALR